MAHLNKEQISEIREAVKGLNDFKLAVIKKLNQKNINDSDVKEILSKLDFIESNTSYIVNLLGG